MSRLGSIRELRPRSVVKWARARRKREVGGMIAMACLIFLTVAWALRDPWPALEYVTLDQSRALTYDQLPGPESPEADDVWVRSRLVPPQPTERPRGRPDRIIAEDRGSFVEARGADLVRVDARSGVILGRISVAPLEVACLGFGSGDRSVRVAVHDAKWVGRVVIWDLESGETRSEPIRAAREFRPVGHSLDGRLGAYEGPLGSIQVWDLLENRLRAGPFAASSVQPVGWSGAVFAPDGQTLVVDRGLATVEVWDLRSGRLRRVLRDHPSGLGTDSLAISPNGRVLAWVAHGPAPEPHFVAIWGTLDQWFPSGGWFRGRTTIPKSVALYDLETGRLLGQAGDADSPRFSPDGRFLATWRHDKMDFAIRPVPPLSPAR